jgi:two-component system, OmpR family, sensor histidine kinase VicK
MFAVAAFLTVTCVVGVIGLFLTDIVRQVTASALAYDVELEDLGDDLRVAVLDVRHYHRNIIFEQAYARLVRSIDELERLGVRDAASPQPATIRGRADAYYQRFRPAIDRYATEPEAFTVASEEALDQLRDLERDSREIDHLGEERAAAAFTTIGSASTFGQAVFLTVIVSLLVAGGVLAYAIGKSIQQADALAARERVAATSIAEAAQSKLAFLADVSHELRTPLTVVRGNAEVCLRLDAGCDHRPQLEEIVRESRRMARLVNDLLFLARSDQAEPSLRRELIPAPLLLAELGARAESLCRELGVTLRLRLAGTGQLLVDPARIEQAVLILIDNAARYGGDHGSITLESAREGGFLRITVSDCGPGIAQEDLPYIFTRRYRGSSPNADSHGHGLGLAIAKVIVDAHGGRIAARSPVGQGAQMTVELRIAGAAFRTPGG